MCESLSHALERLNRSIQLIIKNQNLVELPDVFELDVGQERVGQLEVEVLQLDGGVGTFENSSRETSAGERDATDELEVGFPAEREAVDRNLARTRILRRDVSPDVGRQSLADGRLPVRQEDDALGDVQSIKELEAFGPTMEALSLANVNNSETGTVT